LEQAQKAGLRVYAIAMGTEQGEPIPLKDEQGRKTGFKKDRSGQIVITKVNMPLLEKIAETTGGIALPGTPAEQEIGIILKHMQSLGQRQFKEKVVAEREDHFQLFLFIAFLCLVLETVYSRTRKLPLKPLAVLCLFFLTTGFLDSAQSLNAEGNKLYAEKKYQSALSNYQKAKVKDPDDPAIRYNLGTTYYQLEEYQEAAKEFEKAIASAKDNPTKARALYNYGNTQYRLGNFEKAIESYQKTLEINSADADAKYNLEFLQKEKSLFDKKNQQKKQDQQQNQQQQQQQQNQQQQDQQQNQQQQQQNQQQQQQQDQQQQQGQKQEQEEQEQQQQQEQQKQDQQQQTQQQQRDQEQQQDQQQEQQKEQEQQEQPQEQDEQAQPQPSRPEERQQGKRPLQGQMTLENALQILDAMKDSEKELQDLRRPPLSRNQPQVAKDW
jgi:Ca-activated chloride channel homolog